MSNVSIIVGGQIYSGWLSFTVTASVKNACRTFRLNLAELPGGLWALLAGNPCQVVSDYGLLVDGYIDDFAPSFDGSSHSVGVSGRSKSCDFVDCAAIYEQGGFKDKTILEIGQLLGEPFGLQIISDEKDLTPIPKFQISQGETAFAALEKLAKQQGLLLIGTADGGIDITKAKDKRQAGELVEGINILSANCTFSHAKRFSEYIIKGQSKADSKLKYVAEDAAITRYRPTIIIAETDMDAERCKARAEWAMNRAAGEGTSAAITVRGMADTAGDLYEPNNLIFVNCPTMKIQQDMLIEEVSWTKGQQGTVTNLALVDPRAYGGEAQKTSKSSGGFA
ncbi:MAG: hypothetical protein HRU29_01805 [Rhizobiales bacterium]|nr:hypothetical protein [Hyphomicrobiales bacterium]NRB13110.1 hypothetical protein [Hyphomicrobiales bacterium]